MDGGLSILDGRFGTDNRQLSTLHPPCRGHTLVELITVVLVISILACVAVPRLNFAAVWGAKADAIAERLATDLRHTRTLAITHAAGNPAGFALVMRDPEPYRGYQIVDQQDHATLATSEIPAGVRCGGGRRFEFGPLGNLQNGSATRLQIGTEGKTYVLEIMPATGAVEWRRGNGLR
jgi:prepilin-type N-terminal cleavage/methylation domain-containing protein